MPRCATFIGWCRECALLAVSKQPVRCPQCSGPLAQGFPPHGVYEPARDDGSWYRRMAEGNTGTVAR